MKIEIVNRAMCRKGGTGEYIDINSVASLIRDKVQLKAIEWQTVYSDVYVIRNGERTRLKLNTLMFLVLFFFSNFFLLYLPDNMVLYPFASSRGELSFSYRTDNGFNRVKGFYQIIGAVSGTVMNIIWPFKRPYLVFEKQSDRAQDNGYYFYKYAREYNKRFFFLIREDSPDYATLANDNGKILFGSLKHFYMLYRAKLFVSSETGGHAYYWRQNTGITANVVKSKPYIFLQHGILGFKKLDGLLSAGRVTSPTIFNVSSTEEAMIVKNALGYDNHEIAISGLPRWDEIDLSKARIKEKIVLFYTWRPWLDDVTDAEFEQSDYFKHLMKLVHSIRGNAAISELKQQFIIVSHPKMAGNLEKASKELGVEVWTDEKGPVNGLLDQTAMLITDYSSIAWEAYYRNIPTLFDHFDLTRFEEEIGSFIDLNELPFGEKLEHDDFSDILTVAKREFELTDKDKQNKPSHFMYQDSNNAARVYDLVVSQETSELVESHKRMISQTWKLKIIRKLKSRLKIS